jgi:hypothetical protein
MGEMRFDKLGQRRCRESILFHIAAWAIACLLMPCWATTAAAADDCPPLTFTVNNADDSGAGSLRATLLPDFMFCKGDVITFHPAVFPPSSPATITLLTPLPDIAFDGLTIDASNAGVILDGSKIDSSRYGNTPGLRITSTATNNVIKGLQIVRFPGNGIEITGGAKNNRIGGNWQTGSAPRGEGNIITLNNGDGVNINGTGTSNNTVSGNLIGLDKDGTRDIFPQALVLSPNFGTDKTLFIGTKSSGVWKTTDGGATW